MEEPGRVVAVRDGRADVEIDAGTACAKCGAAGFCSWTGRRSRLVLARNDADARAGDAVVVETDSAGRVVSSGLVFGLLAGAMALGVLAGTVLWGDAGAAVLAGVGLGLAVGALKLIDHHRRATGRGLPVIVRRLGPDEARPECAARPGID
ncbi:MAG: SoxR reducing system RseC family protein [bacterium]